MRNSEERIILDAEQKKKQQKEYVTELFDDTRELENISTVAEPGLPILKEEVENAIKDCKNEKAPGPDGIYDNYKQKYQ